MRSDVVVYGGTAAGIVAAVAAADCGASVTLVSPSRRLGGMTTGGLGATDTGEVSKIGGLARKLYRSIGNRYGAEESYRFEPHVAHEVFDGWIRDATIDVIAPSALEDVERDGPVIRALRVSGNRQVAGR